MEAGGDVGFHTLCVSRDDAVKMVLFSLWCWEAVLLWVGKRYKGG